MSQTCGQFWKPKHDHNEPVLWHNRKQPGKTMFLLFWFILIPFFSVACTMNINFKFIYENNGHTKESTDYTCHRHKMDGLPVFASRAVWHVSFHVVFEVTVIDCHHVCGNCRPLFSEVVPEKNKLADEVFDFPALQTSFERHRLFHIISWDIIHGS